jgi:CubicO group peptidase (beta-lactamase class C family)
VVNCRGLLEQADSSSTTLGVKDANEATVFNIHSVGKVMTGALVMKMVQDGVLQESQFNEPVQLDPAVIGALSEDVQERLKTATLHQLMTNQSGLKDFFGGESGYIRRLEDGIKTGDMPEVNGLNDFLEFADTDVVTLKEGEKKYSNLGLLLVGLAIQKAYNEQPNVEPLEFEEILEKYVIKPAEMTQFSSRIPEDRSNCCVNELDETAPHMPATPDGGQWSNLESLNKFNKWFCDEWQKVPEKGPTFKGLVEKYGQEFYNSEKRVVDHSGASPSSSSYLTILLPEDATPTSLVVLSDKRYDAPSVRNLIIPVIQENHSSHVVSAVDVVKISMETEGSHKSSSRTEQGNIMDIPSLSPSISSVKNMVSDKVVSEEGVSNKEDWVQRIEGKENDVKNDGR